MNIAFFGPLANKPQNVAGIQVWEEMDGGEQWVCRGGGCFGYEHLGDGAAWDGQHWLGGKPANARCWVGTMQIVCDNIKLQ